MPRADFFGDSVTADHKVLSEGCESRNHPYAVVVQDLAKHSGYNHTLAKQTSQETEKELTKAPGADEETKSHSH